MLPNFLGMAKVRGMSNEKMASLIGVSRKTYESKVKTASFTLHEIKCYLRFFDKDFDYLFHEENGENNA